MSNMPVVYEIHDQFGNGVIMYDEGFNVQSPLSTWFLETEALETLYKLQTSEYKFIMFQLSKVDESKVRNTIKNLDIISEEYGDLVDYIYPKRTTQPLIDYLKEEKESLSKLSEALRPTTTTFNEKGIFKMKENEVAVKFYQGYLTNEKISFKKDDGTQLPMKRVKMPNDDPEDTRARRSFIVKESLIGVDNKNPNMRYVYLNKDVEYRVIRKNYDPETKKSETLEDIKMTGQAIADTFQAERDREYAAWKAQQPQVTEDDITETLQEETVIETEEGIEI